MPNLGPGVFSFLTRKKVVDASPHIRRIIDLTTPEYLRTEESRYARRYSRALAMTMWPWVKGRPDEQSVMLGITKDISDSGVCVLSTCRIDCEQVVFTFLVESEEFTDLAFFLGIVARKTRRSGFREYGLRVTEFLNDGYRNQLLALESQIRSEHDGELRNLDVEDQIDSHPKYQ